MMRDAWEAVLKNGKGASVKNKLAFVFTLVILSHDEESIYPMQAAKKIV